MRARDCTLQLLFQAVNRNSFVSLSYSSQFFQAYDHAVSCLNLALSHRRRDCVNGWIEFGVYFLLRSDGNSKLRESNEFSALFNELHANLGDWFCCCLNS